MKFAKVSDSCEDTFLWLVFDLQNRKAIRNSLCLLKSEMLLRVEKKRLLTLAPLARSAFKTEPKKQLFDRTVRYLDWNTEMFNFERATGNVTVKQSYQTEIEIHDGRYEYENDRWYVIFANKHLGGGYLNQGFVQEEILTIECPEIAIALSQFDLLGPLAPNEVGIYMNVSRESEILLYGREGINKCENLDEAVRQVPLKKINLLAIDAVNVSRQEGGVSKADLKYMYNKAVIWFKAVVERGSLEVHTGKWGCGVFGNNLSQIATITILAARHAGLRKIIFHLYDGKDRDTVEKCIRSSSTEMEKWLFGNDI